eukprot:gene9368-1579_t
MLGSEKLFKEKINEFRDSLNKKKQLIKLEINNQKINLQQLYDLVISYGGYEEVSNKNLWTKILKELKITNSEIESTYFLQNFYFKFLFEYEQVYHFSKSISKFKTDETTTTSSKKRIQKNEIPNLKRRKIYNDYDIELIRKIECSMEMATESESISYVLSEIYSLSTCRPFFLLDSVENVLDYITTHLKKIIYLKNIKINDIKENFNLIKKDERKTLENAFLCLQIIENLLKSDGLYDYQQEIFIILNFILKNEFHFDWKKKSLNCLILIGKSIQFSFENLNFLQDFFNSIQNNIKQDEEYEILIIEVFNSILSSEQQITSNILAFEKYLTKEFISEYILQLVDMDKNDYMNESLLFLIFHLTSKESSLNFKKKFTDENFIQKLLVFLKSSDVLTQQLAALILLNLVSIANLSFYESEIALISFKTSSQISSILSVLLSEL